MLEIKRLPDCIFLAGHKTPGREFQKEWTYQVQKYTADQFVQNPVHENPID